MKLFGGKTEGGHIAHEPPPAAAPPPEPEQPEAAEPAVEQPRQEPREKPARRSAAAGFFKSGRLRKFRVPLLIFGCAALVAIAAVTVHAVYVRPPKAADTPPEIVPAVRPAVTERVIATPPPDSLPTQTPAAETPEPVATPEPNVRKDGNTTFVLLATDQVSGNTDTIIVGRLDTENGTLDIVNIPRDTLVNVSWSRKKINTIMNFERGDIDRFKEHLSGLIGFTVDAYAVVNIQAVVRLVNTLGGISFYIPRNMDYDAPDQDLHIHYTEGLRWLNGEDVVKILRFREGNDGTGYANGDIGRIQMQQRLLKSAAEQFLNWQSIPHINEIADIFVENVKTDMTTGNLLYFAEAFLKLDKENVRFDYAPGSAISIRGVSYYELKPEEWVEIVNEKLNPWSLPFTKEQLDILQELDTGGAISTNGEVIPIENFS